MGGRHAGRMGGAERGRQKSKEAMELIDLCVCIEREGKKTNQNHKG